jgi:hypothetical protein
MCWAIDSHRVADDEPGLPNDDLGRVHHKHGRADDDDFVVMSVSLVAMSVFGNKTAGGAEEGEDAG